MTETSASTPSLRRLADAQEGTTILEFGLIAPALAVLLLGALDIGHTLYMQGVLQGAIQKAARDGTMEEAAGTVTTHRDAVDAAVMKQLHMLNKSADIEISRRFYRTFSDSAAAQHEEFTEPSGWVDGFCNNNESFVDANNNGKFDRDGGDSVDNAGARDKVVLTVRVSYPRLFPLDKLVGAPGTTRLTASTVLANQPYGDQASYGAATTRQCGGGSIGRDAQPGEPFDAA